MSSTSTSDRFPHVTRDVAIARLADLLRQPRRTSVAFVGDGEVHLWPACANATIDVFHFGVAPDCPDLTSREVVLLLDDGDQWFELRGVSARGVARAIAEPGRDQADEVAWYAIDPRRVLAWHYGSLREGNE